MDAKDLVDYYRGLSNQAYSLARQGRKEEALKIAYEILTEDDVGLYRRAVVHLLISKIANPEDADLKGHATHSFVCIQKLRENTIYDDMIEDAAASIEAQALERICETEKLRTSALKDGEGDVEQVEASDVVMEEEKIKNGEVVGLGLLVDGTEVLGEDVRYNAA
ncbi:hypothetical protein G7Y89_g8034 [Cudoniella acicularis]|uniref:Uncharacterized protein n=1 Tax=Cudoniella acicularis TaxID=354080 RepID=A0A8H4W3Z2_9HELO|nr:hypothetical protein G7Y89_g8034 [Cudoniella acicularis]